MELCSYYYHVTIIYCNVVVWKLAPISCCSLVLERYTLHKLPVCHRVDKNMHIHTCNGTGNNPAYPNVRCPEELKVVIIYLGLNAPWCSVSCVVGDTKKGQMRFFLTLQFNVINVFYISQILFCLYHTIKIQVNK